MPKSLQPTIKPQRHLRAVESGKREQARSEASAALKLAPNRDVGTNAAFAIARAGDTAGAEKLAAELDKTHPPGHIAVDSKARGVEGLGKKNLHGDDVDFAF